MNNNFDYIIFIPQIDYENRNLNLNSEIISELYEILSSASLDIKKTNLGRLKLKGFEYYSDYKEFSLLDCRSIRLRTNTFINYDGGVYLCQPYIGNSEYCIGNLNSTAFSDIWNSERHLLVIEKLSEAYKNNKCTNCRCIAYNKAVFDYCNLGSNIPFTIVKDSFL